MNKEQFIQILEAALLSFDNETEENILKSIDKRYAVEGIKLSNYLKLKEIK